MNNLSVQEHTTWSGKEQNARRHISVVSWTSSRVAALLLQLRLVVLVTWTSSHLGWEESWCNGVDTDLGLREGRCHHAGEVDHGGLGGTVCELATGRALHETRNGCDVNDGWRITLDAGTALAKEWKDVGGEEEVGGDVGVEGILPGRPLRFEHVLRDRVWVCHVWLRVGVLGSILASDTGVVDEKVYAVWLLLRNPVDKGLDLVTVGYIAGHSVKLLLVSGTKQVSGTLTGQFFLPHCTSRPRF